MSLMTARTVILVLLVSTAAVRGDTAPLTGPSVLLARPLATPEGRADVGSNILLVDGGAILTGWTFRGPHQADGLLMRVDGDGNVIWRRELGGDGLDLLWSILPDPKGGYIVVGFTGSNGAGSLDGWLVHVDGDGTVDWEKTYGSAGQDRLTAIQRSGDGWIAVGQTDRGGPSGTDAWVLRVDGEGNEIGNWITGGEGTDRAFNIRATDDGGCVIVGMDGVDPDADWFATRLDGAGDVKWHIQPEHPHFQVAHDVQALPDGSHLVIGYGWLDEARHIDGFVRAIDDEGRVTLESTFGGATYDRANHGVVFDDGTIGVIGYSQRPGAVDDEHFWDMVFYQLDRGGVPMAVRRFGGTGFEYGRSIAGRPDNVWLIGHTSSGREGSSIFLVRLDASTHR